MTTYSDTTVSQPIINKLTKTQFDEASGLNPTEQYLVDPEFTGGKLLQTDSNGDIVESTITPSNVGTVKTVNSTSPVDGNVTLSIPTDTSDLTNGAGFITGITSTDVTTALGYTPYDSSNPSGYTTNTGTVTSVNNVSPVNGNVTLTIPDAQVQSDWNETNTSSKAYIQNKPTIPTVNNATLTITQGGTTKGTFTANSSTDTTIALDAGGSTLSAGTGLRTVNDEINILQEDYGSQGVTVVGTLTENNGVYSGFSSANYISLPDLEYKSTDDIEIQFKANFNNNAYNSNDGNRIMSCGGIFEFCTKGTASSAVPGWKLPKTQTGTSFSNIYTYPYGVGFDKNTTYWYRLTKTVTNQTSSTVTLSYSTDGINWTSITPFTETVNVFTRTISGTKIGGGVSSNYWKGWIDTNESYIKINGEYWWNPSASTYKPVAKATTSLYGLVKPDGTSIAVNDGVISTINNGTVTSVNNISPVNGNVSLSIPSVDQTYSSSSVNAQSGVAIAGAGFLTSSSISNMQTTTNLVTSVSSLSTDSQYPSAKLFYDTVGNIETLLSQV